MYLAVARCLRAEFEEKVKTGRLSAADLVMIECRHNDPEVSFFAMRADVPHGEAIVPVAGKPAPSFYVTEFPRPAAGRDRPAQVPPARGPLSCTFAGPMRPGESGCMLRRAGVQEAVCPSV